MDTKKLRQKILDLAIRGKLVPQDPNDEPASVLLERIRAEKQQLIKEGKIKAPRSSKASDTSHYGQQTEPFEVPDGWALVKVRDVCVFDSGFAFSGQSYKPCGTPLIRISNIRSDGNISLDDCVFVEPIRDSRYVVQKGDLLIAMSGATTGKMGIYDKDYPAMLNQRVGNVKTISESVLLSGYRDLFFKSLQSQILQDAYGGAQPNISAKNICDYDLLLPPINEQVRIIKEAKTYLQLLEVFENSTAKLDDYTSRVKSRILQMAISGKLVPQDPSEEPAIDLLKRINPAFKPCDKPHYKNMPKGWTVCRLEEILEYEQPQPYIVESTDYSNEYKTPVLTPGKSFILGYTNETSGIYSGPFPIIIFDDFTTASKLVDFPFKVKSSAMKILHPIPEIDIKYVQYFMSITRLVGDTHKRYWISEYSKLIIPIPPLQEQKRIVSAVESLLSKMEDIKDVCLQ